MRHLPIKKSSRQKLVLEAVRDYFGEMSRAESKSCKKIALWIMGRKRGVELTEEETETARLVQTNLYDDTYRGNLESGDRIWLKGFGNAPKNEGYAATQPTESVSGVPPKVEGNQNCLTAII